MIDILVVGGGTTRINSRAVWCPGWENGKSTGTEKLWWTDH